MTAAKRVITRPDPTMMRIIIFGAGAMSCLFAARLAQVAQVTLIDEWKQAIDSIRERGILYEDSVCTRTAEVCAAHLGAPVSAVDLAIVLVKSWQTESIAQFLVNYLTPGGLAISLQNGLGNVEKLGARAFPGATSQGATLLGPGHVKEGGTGTTHVVAPDWVVELLKSGGFDAYRCSPPEAQSLLWGKLCVNCAINPLTALLRVCNGDLLKRPAAKDLMVRAAMECASVARAKGICLPFADPESHVEQIAEKTALNKSSMLQDILRGAPTESDAINGAVVRAGSQAGVATPVNAMLWQLMEAAVHP